MVNALKMGLILCRAHSAAPCEKAVTEDWRFCCDFTLKAGSVPG